MYVILGCGKAGARVAELLLEGGKEVLVVDADATRVEALKERKLHVQQGDMLKLDYRTKPYAEAEALLVMAGSDETNLRAVELVRTKLPKTRIIARVGTGAALAQLKSHNVQFVVNAPDVVAAAVVKELTEMELVQKTDELVALIKAAGDGGLCIALHDAPDPDSIAAALALQKIAEKCKIKSFIYYAGRIGHQQNRALVNLLGIRMRQITPNDDVRAVLKRHGKIALLDCEIAGQNNFVPRDMVPHVVIGHHLSAGPRVAGEFVDVRQNVGAVSTILLGYLQELGLVPDAKLATALLHGIRVDTARLTRHTSPSDLKAVAYLSALFDPKMLDQVESPPMTNDTMDVMGRAVVNRTHRGSYLVSNCGFVDDRDALPQAAEFLLNLEGVATVLCFGIQDETVHLSARSRDQRLNLGDLLQKAYGEQNAGGHALSAGGQIPLGILGGTEDRQELLRLVEKAVVKQFYRAAGLADAPAAEAPPVPELGRPATSTNGVPARGRATTKHRSG